MEIINNEEFCIITPLSPKILKEDVTRLRLEIGSFVDKKIGLNLLFVKECTIEFFELLMNFTNIELFNLQSDIFALMLSMNLDKLTKIYISEDDFKLSQHQLISRKFKLVR